MSTLRPYRTNYLVAVNWLNNHRIMCNNIHKIDESVWSNMRFSTTYYEDPDGNRYEDPEDYLDALHELLDEKYEELAEKIRTDKYTESEEKEYEEIESRFDNYKEELNEYNEDIFQWFLTDCTESDVEYLESTFGLLFTYSEMLDLYILCVDHYGTCWDYVECDTSNENAKAELGEKIK